MRRDDSVLYTGVTSASSRAVAAKRAESQQEKQEKRGKLLPVAELINKTIQKELDMVCDVKGFVLGTEVPEENIKADLLARKMNYEFIVRFHSTINNLLREPKAKKGAGHE